MLDNVTRKLMQDGKRLITVGFWFAISHSDRGCHDRADSRGFLTIGHEYFYGRDMAIGIVPTLIYTIEERASR